jgi:hypothetical protein
MEVGIPYSLETPRGTLYFNGFDQDGVDGYVKPYYRLHEVEGLDGAALRTPNEERPQRDGLIAFPFLRGGRFPALVGVIVPTTLAERREMEDTLRGHMAAMLNVDGTLRWRPRAAHYRWGTVYSSAAVITNAVRAANVEGDGLPATDDSTGVWESTTNLITNGGLETNTTGWSGFNSTITRVTANKFFGAAGGRCAWNSVGTAYDATHNTAISGATGGRIYTASAWVFCTAGNVGKTCYLKLGEEGGASGYAESVTNVTLVAGWQRIIVTRQIAQNDRTNLRLIIGRTGSLVAAEYLEFDGAQMELQPLATPYVETNGATATRGSPALYGSAGAAGGPGLINSVYGPLHPNQGWVTIAFRAGWPTTADPHGGNINLWEWWGGGTKYIRLYFDPYDDKFKLERRDPIGVETVSSAAVAGAAGKVWYVIASWGQSATDGLTISVDGGPQVKAAGSATPPSMEAFTYSWGSSLSGTPGVIDSEILWGALGLGRLTDADCAALYTLQTFDAGGLAALMRGSDFLSDGAQPTVLWNAKDASYLVQQERRVPVRIYEPVQIKSTEILKEYRLGMITPDPLMLSEALYELINATSSPFLLTIDNTLDGFDGTGLDTLWPVVTVAATGGGLTNVDLKNDDTGKFIRLLALGLAGGTSVTVDMRNETIIKSDGTDLSGKLDVTVSEFWGVAPGQQDVASLRNISGSVGNHQVDYRLVFAG